MNNEVLLTNIRNLCKKNGIAVVALERYLGIGAGTISRWNKANPSFDKILAIADYFHVSIDDLAGYRAGEKTDSIDDSTQKIICFLENESESEKNEGFWHDYEEEPPETEFMLDKLCFRKSMGKLFYACDEDGYYLLEVIYEMNDNFDYVTRLKLYLMPDEKTEPILECDSESALRKLYIGIMNSIQVMEREKNAREKVRRQREQILKKYSDLNQE